mmetsp:Transcript_31255/g.81992  ORF Transcript_31255/g.81992 Transcript_31255/m.81992 type:complete len:684 (-) Transcript_31255:652-2703(-)
MASVLNPPEDNQPSVNSTDRDERIKARRLRIQAKEEARKAQERGEGKSKKKGKQENEKKEMKESKKQIAQSKSRLQAMKEDGLENVTDVRVEGDARENIRRIQEESKRQERRQKLLSEAETSAKKNATVAMTWANLFDMDVPLDLMRSIEGQKGACDRIISSKDELIREFVAELKAKDDEYVKALKRQAEDIDVIIERMGKSYRENQDARAHELGQIELAMTKERLALIKANEDEIDSLMDKRKAMEGEFLEMRQARIEEDQKKLDELRIQDSEEYNQLRIRLETDIHTLEQQLEEMRATYQLNTEKLEYNQRVLEKRDEENKAAISQQKRKLAKQQDSLSNYMSKYAKSDKAFKQENMELTEEYKRITEQFKDLQAKFKHFEISDKKRYREIWAMHEETVTQLVRHVLLADKIIHEQQLGLNWYPPDEEKLFAKSASELQQTQRTETSTSAQKIGGGGDGEGEEEEEGEPELDIEAISHDAKEVVSLLCDEAGFLLETKIKKLVDVLPVGEKFRLSAQTILKALGVDKVADVEDLVPYFKGDDGQLVAADTVVNKVKEYVLDKKKTEDTTRQLAAAAKSLGTDSAEDRQQKQRKIVEEDSFWERMSKVISAKSLRVWRALEKMLQKYNSLLTERMATIEDTEQLRRQNEELKLLLNQYLNSKVNDELHIPPLNVITTHGMER